MSEGHSPIRSVVLSHTDLGSRYALQRTMETFSAFGGNRADLSLILTEIVANAHKHGITERLTLDFRSRGAVGLLSCRHHPALEDAALAAIRRARSGWMPDYLDENRKSASLGFPILSRLSRRVTISTDRRTLRLWFHLTDVSME